MCNTLRGIASVHAGGAVEVLAQNCWALHLTLRLLALNVTEGVVRLLAGGMAFGRFTHRCADWFALGRVALPLTHRVATVVGVLGDHLAQGKSDTGHKDKSLHSQLASLINLY